MRLVINKSQLGFTVFDDITKTRIDLFPNTEEGRSRLTEFLKKFVEAEAPPEQKPLFS
jgi:ribosome recycling factor